MWSSAFHVVYMLINLLTIVSHVNFLTTLQRCAQELLMLILQVICIISSQITAITLISRWLTGCMLDVEVGKIITVACLGSSTAAAPAIAAIAAIAASFIDIILTYVRCFRVSEVQFISEVHFCRRSVFMGLTSNSCYAY